MVIKVLYGCRILFCFVLDLYVKFVQTMNKHGCNRLIQISECLPLRRQHELVAIYYLYFQTTTAEKFGENFLHHGILDIRSKSYILKETKKKSIKKEICKSKGESKTTGLNRYLIKKKINFLTNELIFEDYSS